MTNIAKKIGIIGGGQLGRMMILAAKHMGFTFIVLDPTPNCPAGNVADEQIVADFEDEAAIRRLADACDVVTYEFEHINADALKRLEAEGKAVYPTAKSLALIQNKLTQKTVLQRHGLAVPKFMPVTALADIEAAAEELGLPMLLKACTGGYDGKGNFLLHDTKEIPLGFAALGGGSLPLMAEAFFPFTMEISVLACRGVHGEIVVYPVAENIHRDNILDETHVPARISQKTTEDAMELARRVMEVFQGVGMFCVEMFVGPDGRVAVNEVAPRPHNSGHYTIEACVTSQFMNHIRAVSGLPLGDASLLSPCVMRNLLGEGQSGPAQVLGADDALSVPGVSLHIYGKAVSKPKRKMGHLTALASTAAEAEARAAKAFEVLHIQGAAPAKGR